MTMSILINMDEMFYSASSSNVILERENAKIAVTIRTKAKSRTTGKKKIYVRLLPVANVAIRFIAFFRVFTDIEFFSSFFET